MTDAAHARPDETYSYLGPAGTFTEAALKQVPEAAGKHWRSVNNVGEALADVVDGRSVAAMIAIENSVDGGVTATQDALATVPYEVLDEYMHTYFQSGANLKATLKSIMTGADFVRY